MFAQEERYSVGKSHAPVCCVSYLNILISCFSSLVFAGELFIFTSLKKCNVFENILLAYVPTSVATLKVVCWINFSLLLYLLFNIGMDAARERHCLSNAKQRRKNYATKGTIKRSCHINMLIKLRLSMVWTVVVC